MNKKALDHQVKLGGFTLRPHTDKLILSEKNRHWGIKAVATTIYIFILLCDAYYNGLLNLFFATATKRSTFLGFTGCDAAPKKNLR